MKFKSNLEELKKPKTREELEAWAKTYGSKKARKETIRKAKTAMEKKEGRQALNLLVGEYIGKRKIQKGHKESYWDEVNQKKFEEERKKKMLSNEEVRKRQRSWQRFQ